MTLMNFQNNNSRRKQRRKSKNLLRSIATELKRYDWTQDNSTDLFCLPTFVTITGVDDYLVADKTGSAYGCTCINTIQQGTDYYERVGVKVMACGIELTMTLRLVGTALFNSIRYALVYDRQPNGAFPVMSDIWTTSQVGLEFGSEVNMTHTERFIVIADSTVDFDANYKAQVTVKRKIKKKFPIQFQASTGSISDVSAGAVYLICGSLTYAGASGATTSVVPVFSKVVTYFTDL